MAQKIDELRRAAVAGGAHHFITSYQFTCPSPCCSTESKTNEQKRIEAKATTGCMFLFSCCCFQCECSLGLLKFAGSMSVFRYDFSAAFFILRSGPALSFTFIFLLPILISEVDLLFLFLIGRDETRTTTAIGALALHLH